MKARADLHPLLCRQLTKASGAKGELDTDRLLGLVSRAYQEKDADRQRTDRANELMAEELEEAVAASALQAARFKAALDNMTQGLCLFDNNGMLVVGNRRFQEIYGLSEMLCASGSSLEPLLSISPVMRVMEPRFRQHLIREHVSLDEQHSFVEQSWPDGRTLIVSRTWIVGGGYLDTIADITESRSAAARIAHLARHDALTDLANRFLLRERLQEMVRNAARNERCAIMCLDLDCK
ncbi:PAS-domain containing protein [Sphingobium sufflavum]|uniref:PAS-domain containing protein n=1 Tax=Sphingobium sufflavum TaxID=1129547 RepID=UPI001F45B88D|nr:PAS-domain containing protein [Sphingobium sufflavum]MCE7798902.1 PAS-domain containing protein [Sphingobium sufflavum]